MQRYAWLLFVAVCACGPGLEEGPIPEASELRPVPDFGDNPADLSMYLYSPAPIADSAPVVVALHDCNRSAADYVNAGWNRLADAWKFHVVYAEQPAGDGCFSWWSPSQSRRDKGQARSIQQMVEYMKSEHRADAERIFATGFSAGAAMAVALLTAYPDVFSGGAMMTGVPFGCADSAEEAQTCMSTDPGHTPEQWGDLVRGAASATPDAYPRIALWHGQIDHIIRDSNLDSLLMQWTNVHGIDATADETRTVGDASQHRYNDSAGTTLVETWRVASMGHGVAIDPAGGCGVAGPDLLAKQICSTYYAGRFFGLDNVPPSTPPQKPPPTPSPTWTCKEAYATNYHHVAEGRAHLCGFYSLVCANGSEDYLGLYNVHESSWLREVSEGYFEEGRCPEGV